LETFQSPASRKTQFFVVKEHDIRLTMKLVNIVHIFLITHEVRFVRIKERKGFRFGKVKQLVMKNFL
jgi:hypothetical protein